MGSTSADYDAAARARWGDEPAKVSARTHFARDRGRVVHSAALRRLSAKTQVLGPHTDFVRNRLTHTLEVAQVARDLAFQLGCDTDIAETAALAHDLGHPPFGHNGEKALAAVAEEVGGFEGNAQTLRILTRLEAKFLDPEGRSIGLNLTRATLDAATKYPWPRGAGSTKFGVYDDDLPVFTWMRDGAPDGVRCLEAQVMDLSDDIAYSVHDVEDGIVAERVELLDLADRGLRREVWSTARAWYHPDAPDEAFEEAWSRLTAVAGWPEAAYDGSRAALGALKNLTSVLIGRFCAATTEATHAVYGAAPLGRYDADLVVPDDTLLEIGVLKGIAAHLVMEAAERVGVLAAQRELLTDLVAAVRAAGPSAMEPMFRADLAEAADDAARLRVVVDQVASLTDASAVSWHRRLC